MGGDARTTTPPTGPPLRVAACVILRHPSPALPVFDHADPPEAGTQVPAGGIAPGEDPERAVLREVAEETGPTGALGGRTGGRRERHGRAPLSRSPRSRCGDVPGRLGRPYGAARRRRPARGGCRPG
ncbi:NUDIX domain-containing protein [Streptomyces griseus]|uniref:NUDIX domain-containing protein n=1 Tax=Streptomyces griseus TaxID=1911 RepID=UPI003699F635